MSAYHVHVLFDHAVAAGSTSSSLSYTGILVWRFIAINEIFRD